MILDDVPLFGMLRQKLGYLDQRQRLIAQNVANADTPGFRPSDLAPFQVESASQIQMAGAGAGLATSRSEAGHLAGVQVAAPSPFKVMQQSDSETTLDGNGVTLEEQMMKMSESRMDFDAAVGFYQKAMNLIQMAARAPGR
ncbi:MAG: flgB [Caulobacteraceae bacterium]|nr:flgB [Caulobacteraceae bacterium]